MLRFLFREPMVVYAAYEPPDLAPDRIERAAAIEFIKDGIFIGSGAFCTAVVVGSVSLA